MAAFRKGHVKVVKWMVKRVTRFPSDQEKKRQEKKQATTSITIHKSDHRFRSFDLFLPFFFEFSTLYGYTNRQCNSAGKSITTRLEIVQEFR